MGSCAAPSAKGDDKFITTDYLQQCPFPSLGMTGAMVAALCGMMPWLTKFAKEAPSKAFGMVMASLCIAPVYGKLCELVIHAIQGA